MLTLAKLIGAPGSWGFLTIAGVLALAFARTRPRRLAWVLILLGFYAVLGLPVVATALADRLGSWNPLHDTGRPAPGTTLVVLGGDNGLARDREARRLVHALRPETAVVLGDPGISRSLLAAGIPPDRLVDDRGAASTTREQILYLASWQNAHGHPLVVVASRLHMRRVVRVAGPVGLTFVPAPSGVDEEPATNGSRRWIPSLAALHVSRDAIYEHVALAYYGWRGWLDSGIGPDAVEESW